MHSERVGELRATQLLEYNTGGKRHLNQVAEC